MTRRHYVIPDVLRCTKCEQDKPISAYNIRKDRGQPYRQCRDCMAARKWATKNPERQRALSKAWESENKDRIRAIWREMAARKRERNPAHRINARISNQIYAVLRAGKNRRGTFSLVGYTADVLRAHLERQFLPGMGWHNLPEWHVDHIVPLSSFKITGPDDPGLKRAWALSNLRPLWATDNLRKGAKLELLV